MKLYCNSEYHNEPHSLHFMEGPIEVDEPVGEFLLRDAPENFKQGGEGEGSSLRSGEKALDAPPKDKAVKASNVKVKK